MRMFLGAALVLCICASRGDSEELRVLAWNVESGGNQAGTIADELTALQSEFGPLDLVGLTEVSLSNAESYRQALGDHYQMIASNTGGGDRMVILFDSNRLELQESLELTSHEGIPLNVDNRFRSPLVAEFQERQGARRFLFMVNHLARGDSQIRTSQAKGLREWGRDQTLPVINCGDFNFDAAFDSPDDAELEGNAAFDEFFEDEIWTWIRPVPLIDTNHSGNGAVDRHPDSILDYICVANQPEGWSTLQSEVIVRTGDFPDDNRTSDHRPVFAAFESDDDEVDVSEVLDRIRRIRAELDSLERMLEGR